jgi:hypothetical protein
VNSRKQVVELGGKLSKLNQILISCKAVPLAMSLFNFVTACMGLIQKFMCSWSVLRKVKSFRSFGVGEGRVGVGGLGFGDCVLDCGGGLGVLLGSQQFVGGGGGRAQVL